jgi:hypothetical protein
VTAQINKLTGTVFHSSALREYCHRDTCHIYVADMKAVVEVSFWKEEV